MVIIRNACLKDVENIIDLWKEFMKNHQITILKVNPKLKPHLIKKKTGSRIFSRHIKRYIKSKNGNVNVAEVKGKLVGYSLFYIKENIPVYKLKKVGYFSDLYIIKEFRGQKISSKFKNIALKWFKRKGIKYASIEVNTDNKLAYSIYKKWGFVDFHTELRKKI